MKRLFSSSEDEKEDTPELITLEEEEQKEIDALGNDTEDEATKTTNVKDIEEEKNEDTLPRLSLSYTFENNDLPSQSENEESSSDVDNKEPAQTSKIVRKNEWMKQKIKLLEHEVKIQEMQNQIIKYEISNVNSIQDIRQLKKTQNQFIINLYHPYSEIRYPQFKNISKSLIIQEIRKILWENLEIFLLMLLAQDLISFLWLDNYFSSMIQGFKSK